jgi:hypothetical protein
MFEIWHNHPSPGFISDGAQFTTQCSCSISPVPISDTNCHIVCVTVDGVWIGE